MLLYSLFMYVSRLHIEPSCRIDVEGIVVRMVFGVLLGERGLLVWEVLVLLFG